MVIPISQASYVQGPPKLEYNTGLAGLRGILALLVLFFHTGVPAIPGGARAVDMFFVLSGFLITGLLISEIEENGTIDYLGFLRRRKKRLLPPLLLFTLVYIFLPDDVAAFRWRDAFATLTYTYNWDLVLRPRLTGMGHMWSLALEGQFYLLWPILFPYVYRAGRRAITILLSTFVLLTAFRIIGMILLREDSSLIIYSLPGHSSGLVLGALLAFLPARPRWLGYLGVAGMAAFILLPDRHDDFWGQMWTISVAELSAAGLICGLVQYPQTWLNRALSNNLLLALGGMSYEIYIWHFPFQRYSSDASWIISSIFTLTFALLFASFSRWFFRASKRKNPGHFSLIVPEA